MRVFLMMRARGLLGPVVNKGNNKPATTASPKGAISAGNYIVYKKNNP